MVPLGGELHQGLSLAVMKGVVSQLRSLPMAREPGYYAHCRFRWSMVPDNMLFVVGLNTLWDLIQLTCGPLHRNHSLSPTQSLHIPSSLKLFCFSTLARHHDCEYTPYIHYISPDATGSSKRFVFFQGKA
jgi:hypothetical protein